MDWRDRLAWWLSLVFVLLCAGACIAVLLLIEGPTR